jgi:iron complex outermembrane receptor protein
MAQQAETITVTAAPASRAGDTTTVLSAADIARSGASNLGDLLNQLPSFGTQGVNGSANDGGYGEYFVDLRNLNFNRTLVLVDGKRFVLSGIQTDEAVDLNSIPVAFIDHVEVLRDGTQPGYAVDAVAGVVNVVLKDQVDGLHLDTYGGGATARGAGTGEVSLTGGHSLPDGHLAFGLDVYRRDPVLQSDRSWAANPIASATATTAGSQFLFGSPATAGGHAIGAGVDAVALGGGRTRAYDPAQDYFDPAPDRYLQGGLQRASLYADADTRLTDSVSADAEMLFTDRRATTSLPPEMLGLNGTQKHPDGFVVPGADPFNPFGEAVTLERTVSETGPQETTTSGPVWRVLGGLEGTLGAWNWSLGYNHGQSFSRYDATNQIDLTRALATVGDGACPQAAGCVAADWFGPGSLSRQALSYIAYTGKTQSRYAETQGLARIGGPVGTLPGGTARLSLGGEIRSEAGSTSVDAVTARGDQAGPDAAATSGGYETYEAFGTADLPLLRDLPGIRALSLQLAGRENATSRYGGLPALRAAVDYVPLPGVHLHAITGTARRPPAITEAFGGITATAQEVADPCDAANGLRGNPVVAANCAAQGLGPGFRQTSPLIQVESGGNAHLHPEQSENETLGVTLAPPAWPFLSASVDWYHYRVRGAIDSLADTNPEIIPDGCYESAHLGSPLCGLITRIGGGGNAGQIGNILALDENVGTIKTDGLEFGMTARLELPDHAALKLDAETDWLLDYRLHTAGTPGFAQYAGTRLRSRVTAALDWRDWSASATTRVTSGGRVLDQAPGSLFGQAPAIVYEDLQVSRRFHRVTAMLGVDNLLDRRPPTLVDGETNTSTATYDVVGRFIFGRVSYDF